jgi:hypothetical protein
MTKTSSGEKRYKTIEELLGKEKNVSVNEVKIVRGYVASLSLYEITDHELDVLEKGTPGSLHLNFGILLLSVGSSFLITLLSTNIQSNRIFTIFVVLCSIGIIGGTFLVFLWYRMKGEVTNVVRKIKNRIAEQDSKSGIPDESQG